LKQFIYKVNNGTENIKPQLIQSPIFNTYYPHIDITEIIPIASCIKAIGSESFFPPKIYQEVVFIFSFTYKRSTEDMDEMWGIMVMF
jgi:hypothetical protein